MIPRLAMLRPAGLEVDQREPVEGGSADSDHEVVFSDSVDASSSFALLATTARSISIPLPVEPSPAAPAAGHAAAASSARYSVCRGVLVSSALVSCCLLTLAAIPGTAPPDPKALRGSKQEVALMNSEGAWKGAGDACAATMENVDIPGYDIETRDECQRLEDCCWMCNQRDDCNSWVFIQEANRCYLKDAPDGIISSGTEFDGWVAGRRSQGTSAAAPQEQRKSFLQVVGHKITSFFHGSPSDELEETSTTTPSPSTSAPALQLEPAPVEAMACGLIEEGVEYLGNDLEEVNEVGSADDCCVRCSERADCFAWSLEASTCKLKGSSPKPVLTSIKRDGVTSGKPAQASRHIETAERDAGQSLFCWALMIPDSYEVGLLKLQYDNEWGIFGCDEYSIYSKGVIEVVDGLKTVDAKTKLDCDMGGEFGTALNTEVFLKVWARVLEMGRWNFHDWTAKVDPDCPFSPARLRGIVGGRNVDGSAVYLNNCKWGLHGPLEVFSRAAVGAWQSGREQCTAYFRQQCGGDCAWGEDMYIDQCLDKVLHVRRELEDRLLREEHCDPPAGWSSCAEPQVVAFHPYKGLEEYEACMQSMGG